MKTIKPLLLIAAVLGVGAGIFAGLQFSATADARTALAALTAGQAALQARIAAAETRLQAEAKRVQAVESDNTLLDEALARAQTERKAKETPVTREMFDARFKGAQRLVMANGDSAEALRELLWCWDEALPRLSGSTANVRKGSVIFLMGRLAETYPEAMAVLRARQESLRQRVLAGPGGVDAVAEFSQVLEALKEPQAALAVYDQIPAGDRRRGTLGIYSFEPMWEARRYADIVGSRSYATMSSAFERDAEGPPLPATMPNAEEMRARMRQTFITKTVKNIEALAGSGDLANARDLAGRLLAHDPSADTRAMVQKHLERAGQPGLLNGKTK